MAYDLVVGKSPLVRDKPTIVGELTFEDLPHISALLQRRPSRFLQNISNIFEDQRFTLAEVEIARGELHAFLPMALNPGERALVHMLLAVLSFASVNQQSLFGVAD